MAIDPDNSTNATRAINTLADHRDIFLREGILAAIFGFVGGTIAFLVESHRRSLRVGWPLAVFYVSKVGFGCVAAYMALLLLPIFGLGVSVYSEQAISILAAIVGSDFVGLLLRRILGTQADFDHGKNKQSTDQAS